MKVVIEYNENACEFLVMINCGEFVWWYGRTKPTDRELRKIKKDYTVSMNQLVW